MVRMRRVLGPRHDAVPLARDSALVVRNTAFSRPLKRAQMGVGCVVTPRLKPGATVLAQDLRAVRERKSPSCVAAICFARERALDVREADVRSVAPGFSRGGARCGRRRSEPASAGDRQVVVPKPGARDVARDSVLVVLNAAAKSSVPSFCRPRKRAPMGTGRVVNPRLKPGATALAPNLRAVRERKSPSCVAAICFARERALDVREADVRSVAPGFSRGFRAFREHR